MATRKSTAADGPEYKKKNSEGRSFKHIADSKAKNDTDSGGDKLTRKTAKVMHRKGTKPGVGVADLQAPSKQRERKVNIDAWCQGKGEYKRPERKPRGLN